MDDHSNHIRDLEKKISALSDALAHLGKGTTLQELLRIIRFPGYTTPAEFTFNVAILDTMLVRMGQLRDEAAYGGKQAVLCGDFNIAHTPLDIKNAKANEKHAGFLPEERAYVDKWLGELEFVDVMRSLCGDIQGPYTWWSQRGRAFDNNVGWRIDYQFATPELAETARGFVIDKAPTYDLRWSDHAPLSITYDV